MDEQSKPAKISDLKAILFGNMCQGEQTYCMISPRKLGSRSTIKLKNPDFVRYLSGIRRAYLSFVPLNSSLKFMRGFYTVKCLLLI